MRGLVVALRAGAGRRNALRIFWEIGREFGRRPRVSVWVAVAAALAIAFAPAVRFPDSLFPVQAVERNLPHIAPEGSMPRVLTSDQWADYVIFRLYPRQRVFFDGRSDFFGPAIGADYRRLLLAERSWRDLLLRYRFDLALLPHDWPLSTALDREPGWHRVYSDSVAVLFTKVAP
jgi:hypothetical protein